MKRKVKMNLTRLLAGVVAVSTIPVPKTVHAASFSDISGHWAETTIQQLYRDNIVSGYEDGTILPNNLITRAEFVTIVNRASGNTTRSNSANFSDVSSNAWYADQVDMAVSAGFIQGYEDGTFRPSNNISRQEAAVVMANALKLNGNPNDLSFIDNDNIASWAQPAVASVLQAGIIRGFEDNSFRPTQDITRAEAFTMVHNANFITQTGIGIGIGIGTGTQTSVTEREESVTDSATTVVTAGQTFGNATEVTEVYDLKITGTGSTVQNVVVLGDLTITEEVADGKVNLDNVTVKGNTFIYGGGRNTVTVNDSDLQRVVINKKDNNVRLTLDGTTKVNHISLQSGAIVESNPTFTGKVNKVVVESGVNSGVRIETDVDKLELHTNITLTLANTKIGEFTLSRSAAGARVATSNTVEIGKAVINGASTFTGNGVILSANISVSGVRMDRLPNSLASGSLSATGNTSSGGSSGSGGSGGGGGTTPTPAPVRITLANGDEVPNILQVGTTLQFRAINPSNTALTGVTWTNSNQATVGSINSSTGAFTPTGAGTTVITAQHANGTATTQTITITEAEITPPPAPGDVQVQGITVSIEQSTIEVNKTTTATATITPSNATNRSVIWTIDDAENKKSKIDASGVITAGDIAEEITVRATSVARPTISGTATVKVVNELPNPDILDGVTTAVEGTTDVELDVEETDVVKLAVVDTSGELVETEVADWEVTLDTVAGTGAVAVTGTNIFTVVDGGIVEFTVPAQLNGADLVDGDLIIFTAETGKNTETVITLKFTVAGVEVDLSNVTTAVEGTTDVELDVEETDVVKLAVVDTSGGLVETEVADWEVTLDTVAGTGAVAVTGTGTNIFTVVDGGIVEFTVPAQLNEADLLDGDLIIFTAETGTNTETVITLKFTVAGALSHSVSIEVEEEVEEETEE